MTPTKKKWISIERIDNYNPLAFVPPMEDICRRMPELGLVNIPQIMGNYNNTVCHICVIEKEWLATAKENVNRVMKHPQIIFKVSDDLEKFAHKLGGFCNRFYKLNLDKLSNSELSNIYYKYLNLQRETHFRRAPGWLMDQDYELLSKAILKKLASHLKKIGSKKDPAALYSILITPTKPTLATYEQISLLTLAKDISSRFKLKQLIVDSPVTKILPVIKKDYREIYESISIHRNKFFYLYFSVEGPAMTEADIIDSIKDLLKDKDLSPADKLQEHQREKQDLATKQTELKKELKITKRLENILDIAKLTIFYKAYTKDYQFLGYSVQEEIIKQIARRCNLSLTQARYLIPTEVKKVLINNKYNLDLLNERFKSSVLYFNNNKTDFMVGSKKNKFISSINLQLEPENNSNNIKKLEGQTAYPGFATGKVKIINLAKDLFKMKPGDVLVSRMTIPEIVPAMKQASAIITNAGGITCHAAIVSRELGIPCIIGTKYATNILKDEDEVEVDAHKGKIRIIE